MRVSAAETPEYARKQMKIVIKMLQGMERRGFSASPSATLMEVRKVHWDESTKSLSFLYHENKPKLLPTPVPKGQPNLSPNP